jgi:hypothetical protein
MPRASANKPVEKRVITIKDTSGDKTKKIDISINKIEKTVNITKSTTEKSEKPVLSKQLMTSVKADLTKIS